MRNRLILLFLILLGVYIGWKVYNYRIALEALPDRSVLIQAKFEAKLESYGKEIRRKCDEDILNDARLLADSIAFLKADSLMLFDTIRRPPKPGKPVIPDKLPLKDSLQIAPLIPEQPDTLI